MKFHSSFLWTAIYTKPNLVAFPCIFWAVLIFCNGEGACSVGRACAAALPGYSGAKIPT